MSEPNKNETQKPVMTNWIRNNVHIAMKLSEYTKLPFLFLSNPGLAKTTNIRSWCKKNQYELTTLIGSQRTAEEVLGYMVNDSGKLVTYTPDWFDEIWENHKTGKKTALFLDELSQAAENVQGAMLQLIFDRKVGGRDNYLPSDCLVIAAANYKENLPPQCTMQAPTLNRFVIVNLEAQDSVGMLEEFLQSTEEMEADPVVFGNKQITPDIENSLRRNLKIVFKKLFQAYSNSEQSESSIDVKNHSFNEMFDQPGKIYNFISGRSINYMYRLGLGLIHLEVCKTRYEEIVLNMCFGLCGAGTCNFKNDQAKNDYEISFGRAIRAALRQTIESVESDPVAAKINYTGTISDSINKWTNYSESTSSSYLDENFTNLVDVIKKKYGTTEKEMEKVLNSLKNQMKTTEFMNDIQKLDSLIKIVSNVSLTEMDSYVRDLSIVYAAYEGYANQIFINMVK